ncbi:hypothetical protein Z517_11007 [Fonsecaea pedrosoi CBS 271.37]|uniref:Unplaced genomic scaffold supercont1.7, whole genome shotgun sequence n=1 Tax=Fonsecaea pedrosoi CBS 271.37 TaxID=1442368 RepID=A0A0D2DEZ0_9EURO|nr:uncharacterized protein Z517_11007 [Fonsecaea pedrosoi CBS 271.37]KIW76261.1 hypothetical protein Z517_11007 [Fonsecaea pedrosoi CBS 271.37]
MAELLRTITHISRRSSLSERSTKRTDSIVEREHKALAELRELCRKNDVSWPKSELVADDDDAVKNDGNEDSNLLRYLRARKYDVPAAFKQYAASAKWRHEIQLEKTYDDVDITKFETIRRLQPQWTGRRDDTGVPIMVYVVAQVKPEDILALHKMDPSLSSVFLAAEYVTQFVQPLCGKLQRRRTTRSINIIDLSHVGIPTFWRLRRLLNAASTMATAHYPETVKRIYVVGAPPFFPQIWKFITLWFEKETTRKIFVLGHHESADVLRRDLGAENVPKRFGGDLDWEFGAFPKLRPEDREVFHSASGDEKDDSGDGSKTSLFTKWVEGPLRLLEGREGRARIVAVGSRDGVLRREEV